MNTRSLYTIITVLMLASMGLFAQGFNVGGAVHLALPTEDFGGQVGTGFGATGLLIYPLNDNSAISGQIGFIKFGGGSVETLGSFGSSGSVDWSWSAIPILGGYRFYLKPAGEQFRFHVGGEAGFHRYSFSSETEVMYTDPFSGQTISETQSFDGSSTEFSIAGAAGFEMPNGVDVSVVYMIADLDYLGVRVGFTRPMGN